MAGGGLEASGVSAQMTTRTLRARAPLGRRANPGEVLLPEIPVVETGPDFALDTLAADPVRARDLMDSATRRVPRTVLKALDAVSRRWLAKWDNTHLAEIDAVARGLGRPGAYFLSVQYEWACTCAVKPSADGHSAQLVRVLDWRTPGLGRHVMAARVAGAAGSYVTFTWPGFSGVIQGVAKGRFAAALNQAPMPVSAGVMPLDWAMARGRLWRSPHPTAAHTLRQVFDTAHDYGDARDTLASLPIAAPAIFSLAGVAPGEMCVIERTETEARIRDGAQVAANHWHDAGYGRPRHPARPRGVDSHGRAALMPALDARLAADFGWARYPVLNQQTRLILVAEARTGAMVAQGFEAGRPATAPLSLSA